MEITKVNLKKPILIAIADQEMVKILNSTNSEAKSVMDLMEIHNISNVNACRKTKRLRDHKLLKLERYETSEEGKKNSFLRNALVKKIKLCDL